METQEKRKDMLYSHVSVDCVLLGISEDQLSVLLVERSDVDGNKIGFKLPGSLIYDTETLDEAAYRVLNETTGLKRISLKQFRCFGSPSRTKNKDDLQWLENALKLNKVSRIVTVAYLALCKNTRKFNPSYKYDEAQWFKVDQIPHLPFDHKEIIEAAVQEMRAWMEKEPAIVFDYLPSKFTAFQLRRTYEIIYNKEMDVRNFHKKMNSLEYVVPTDDIQDGVAHRAARYYRFDKVKYNKQRSKFNKN
ncbi:NUDIX domain-containing protein [Parabacteroides sp. PF5-9]|uniref:NUDIX hydrolase n=1 Tax=Parabacteroides sp. PF5-9 TaxID=1742404 RepID=UPI0024752FA4|nr:NUDIX domain-containing protein [Parabacteroides sp. PF5-9]